MNNVMIDLETLGLKSDALITSIGACEFEPMTGEIGRTFEIAIDWQSEINHNRSIDASVLKWWFEQSEDATAQLLKPGTEFYAALHAFTVWMPENAKVWGNGPSFDITKLETAYEMYMGSVSDDPFPWKFYNVRCVRTIKELTKGVVDRDDVPFIGEKHTALADAMWQAKYVSKMYQAIKKGL